MHTSLATLLAASLLALGTLPAFASAEAPEGAPPSATLAIAKAQRHVPAELASPIVGTWTINYSWDCTGTYRATSIDFNDDRTFITGEGGSGTWKQRDVKVKWVYTSGTTYKGTQTLDNRLEGRMVSYTGRKGCWYATR